MYLVGRTALFPGPNCTTRVKTCGPCVVAAGIGHIPQVAPPAEFHRPSKNFDTPIGVFEGQSDIGSAVVPGSASYDATTKQYTINSAGYNVWYIRDEFRYSVEENSGDVSLAADITFPDTKGYGDRKAVLIIRQDLDDDSKEMYVALHGEGMIQLAQRPTKSVRIKDMEYRIGAAAACPAGRVPTTWSRPMAKRIGIEKRGDSNSRSTSA